MLNPEPFGISGSGHGSKRVRKSDNPSAKVAGKLTPAAFLAEALPLRFDTPLFVVQLTLAVAELTLAIRQTTAIIVLSTFAPCALLIPPCPVTIATFSAPLEVLTVALTRLPILLVGLPFALALEALLFLLLLGHAAALEALQDLADDAVQILPAGRTSQEGHREQAEADKAGTECV